MRRLPLHLLCLFLLFAFGTSGCYRMLTKEAKREFRWKKRMARGADGADGALRSARSLINVPTTKKTDTLIRYRMMGIRTISLIMETRGFDATLDAEAHRYYEEALELGAGDRARGELARLYEHTGRAGKIAALLGVNEGDAPASYESAIRLWRRQLAQGDLAASELTWQLAETFAGLQFRTLTDAKGVDKTAGLGGRYNIEGTDYRARYEVLRQRMTVLASTNDSPTGRIEMGEIVKLWKEAEVIGTRSADDIMGRSYGDVYPVYLDGARVFAIAGEHEAANALLELGRSNARGETSEFRGAHFACTEAFLASRARSEKAVELTRKCLEIAKRSSRELDIRELVTLGEALERGDELGEAETVYRDAITRAERQRDSFPVDERTVYFRTSVRRGYWGLARTLARASQKSKGAASSKAFVGALAAIEQVRARQMGELLVESGKQLGVVDDLGKLRAALGTDGVLLDYVVMDDEVMLLAVDGKRHAVHTIPLDAQTIGHVSATIAAALSTPQSDLRELDDTLTLLGRALIMPVREMVEGKRRIVVLPDGALNAVPFDLLDTERDAYRPLVERFDVEVTPSLALLLAPSRPSTATGLLGVGDPVYGAIPEVAMENAELEATARAATAGYFVALPETRRELEAIARTLGGNTKLLFGTDANESAITTMPLGDFGIVHFATHGILGRDVPGIDEPALVLAAEPGGDGFLTATEASKLALSARLTVLSACKTGAGDSASGEGVLGMSRAFMLAGSESVVVSLWSVDSLATEALMVEFYRRLAAGESSATALRGAKLAVRDGTAASPIVAPTEPAAPPKKTSKSRKPKTVVGEPAPVAARRDHPYYWGAFIVVGS